MYDLAGAAPITPFVTLSDSGFSVSVSGTRVVTGAPDAANEGGGFGRVDIYDLATANPAVAVVTLNNTPAAHPEFNYFGFSVGIRGNRVVVGAPYDDTRAVEAGSAYVYDLAASPSTGPVATLNNPGPSTGDAFGSSVAISGTRMVVGSPFSNSAYVYDLTSSTFTEPIATLNYPGSSSYGQFGASVAIAGTQVVVGAPYDDTGARFAGSAYVYDLANATPHVPLIILNNPSPQEQSTLGDQFGYSVAISGALVVVGAIYDSSVSFIAGNVYVFDLSSTKPTVPLFTLQKPDAQAGDGFGFALAMSDTWVVVGSPGTDQAGAAYVYDLTGSTPAAPKVTLDSPSPATSHQFGFRVGIAETRVVVGTDRPSQSSFHSAYVYDVASANPMTPVASLDSGPTHGLAISGSRVVLSTFGETARIYDLGSATPSVPVATLHNPNPATDNGFGLSVAIEDTTVAIGTPYDSATATRKGAVYIFAPNSNDADGDGLLDIWEMAHFGATTGHGAQDDSDGDGRRELLELAFDTDPTRPDAAAAPVVVNESGFLTLTLTKRAGVTYLGESAATPDAAAFSPATTQVLINNATTLKVRDTFPMSGGGQRFLRVKVTAAP